MVLIWLLAPSCHLQPPLFFLRMDFMTVAFFGPIALDQDQQSWQPLHRTTHHNTTTHKIYYSQLTAKNSAEN